MKKQTAVEWLVEILLHKIQLTEIEKMYIEQAKQMEKEQIIDACSIGFNDGCAYMHDGNTEFKSREQYYKETYGGENE